jgi:hypothetical protein
MCVFVMCVNRQWLCCAGGDGSIPLVVAALHQWWLCNSSGCNGVVCSESGADLQNDHTPLMFVGAGQSHIPANFVGSIVILFSLIINPRYSTSFMSNLHFSAFKNGSCSQSLANTRNIHF